MWVLSEIKTNLIELTNYIIFNATNKLLLNFLDYYFSLILIYLGKLTFKQHGNVKYFWF